MLYLGDLPNRVLPFSKPAIHHILPVPLVKFVVRINVIPSESKGCLDILPKKPSVRQNYSVGALLRTFGIMVDLLWELIIWLCALIYALVP